MDIKRTRASGTAVLIIVGMALTGCSGGNSSTDDPTSATHSGAGEAHTVGDPGAGEESAEGDESGSDDECYVHLFDSDDFDETDDNFKLTQPGRYGDLSDLPGAEGDWTDEADSARVGSGATVTTWSEPDFAGESATLDPGSEHASLDTDVSSLEMTC